MLLAARNEIGPSCPGAHCTIFHARVAERWVRKAAQGCGRREFIGVLAADGKILEVDATKQTPGRNDAETASGFGDDTFTFGRYLSLERTRRDANVQGRHCPKKVTIRPVTRLAGIGNDSQKSRICISTALARHYWRQRQSRFGRPQGHGKYP
jgi:hypothetical protein